MADRRRKKGSSPSNPTIKTPADWENNPEWQRKIKLVLSFKSRGYDENQIAIQAGIPPMEVRRIYNDEAIVKAAALKAYNEMVPVIRETVGLGLDAIREGLKEMVLDPDFRAKHLSRLSDYNMLVTVVEKLNGILRLEEDKSTVNVASNITRRTYQETRQAIQELKKIDPVFDYPKLPEQVTEAIDITPSETPVREAVKIEI